MLAAECLRDVGVEPGGRKPLETEVQQRLRSELERGSPIVVSARLWQVQPRVAWVLTSVASGGRWPLSRIEQWPIRRPIAVLDEPYGEPEWVEIPAGEFWMGEERDDSPC